MKTTALIILTASTMGYNDEKLAHSAYCEKVAEGVWPDRGWC